MNDDTIIGIDFDSLTGQNNPSEYESSLKQLSQSLYAIKDHVNYKKYVIKKFRFIENTLKDITNRSEFSDLYYTISGTFSEKPANPEDTPETMEISIHYDHRQIVKYIISSADKEVDYEYITQSKIIKDISEGLQKLFKTESEIEDPIEFSI